MGQIISLKEAPTAGENKVAVEVLMEYDEFLQLRGNLNDVHLFTEKVSDVRTNISHRGKNEATKYFLIPRQFRKGLKFNHTTSCQRFDLTDKVVFIYVIDRLNLAPTKRQETIRKIQENYERV